MKKTSKTVENVGKVFTFRAQKSIIQEISFLNDAFV